MAEVREYLKEIVDEILVKVYEKVKRDENMDEGLKAVLLDRPNTLLIKIFSLPLYEENERQKRLNQIKEVLRVMSVDSTERILDIANDIANGYKEWSKKSNIGVNTDVFMELGDGSMDDFDDDEFFDFEAEFTDENIGRMHYEERDKIKAENFLSIYNDEELEEIEDKLHSILDFCDEKCTDPTVSEEYINGMKDFLTLFKDFFDEFDEFKDLSYSLEKLINKLDEIDVDTMDSSQKIVLHDMLEKVFVDLEDWARNVIFSKTAVDIHYIDASLTANVDQIEIILNYMGSSKGSSEDNSSEIEDEFFDDTEDEDSGIELF